MEQISAQPARWNVEDPDRYQRHGESWVEYHNRIADENDRNEQPYHDDR